MKQWIKAAACLTAACLTAACLLALAVIAPLAAAAQAQDGGAGPAQQDAPQSAPAPGLRVDAEQLFALANQARAQAGVDRLTWDPALAAAALAHCRRMAEEGPIAHRYGGELDVTGRAAQAGAHFSTIEENVAVGSSAAGIQDGWMHSPPHRANLLSPAVDRVGIAVVAARGVLYAVADFSRAVPNLAPAQVEAQVAGLIRARGVAVRQDAKAARAACATDVGSPRTGGEPPRFIMRWQGSDLSRLPPQLTAQLASSGYRQAEVGSCPAEGADPGFTVYRVAVLLY